MALSKIQRGELTNRLRNFFGLTGNFAADLDTTVAAVATVQNLDDPPFRQTGYRFFCTYPAPAVALDISALSIKPELNVSAVVDRIWVSCTDATAGTTRPFRVALAPADVYLGPTALDLFVPEAIPSGSPASTPHGGPIVATGFQNAGPMVSGTDLISGTVRGGEMLALDVQIAVPYLWELLVLSESVNVPMRYAMTGRWFPTAGA